MRSPPTIDRILKPIRFHYTKRGRSTTKPGTLLRKQIPIKTNQWDDRLDNPNVVPPLNDLYTKEWRLFHNFFCPSVKLIAKERIGSKTIKRHDPPKTPYHRIIDSPHIQESVKLSLSKQLENLNPFLLRKTMDKKLKNIFSVNNKLE
jgi:hypothetical protein